MQGVPVRLVELATKLVVQGGAGRGGQEEQSGETNNLRGLQLQGAGFKRCRSPLSAWEAEQETGKKLKAKKKRVRNK